jgi:hypothetical protein
MKFQTAATVAARNKKPGRISANREHKTSNRSAATMKKMRRGVNNG